MSKITIEELCPFAIGDTLEVNSRKLGKQTLVITDIVTVHSKKSNSVTFKYEFNASGQYVTVDMFNEAVLSKFVNAEQEEQTGGGKDEA